MYYILWEERMRNDFVSVCPYKVNGSKLGTKPSPFISASLMFTLNIRQR